MNVGKSLSNHFITGGPICFIQPTFNDRNWQQTIQEKAKVVNARHALTK